MCLCVSVLAGGHGRIRAHGSTPTSVVRGSSSASRGQAAGARGGAARQSRGRVRSPATPMARVQPRALWRPELRLFRSFSSSSSAAAAVTAATGGKGGKGRSWRHAAMHEKRQDEAAVGSAAAPVPWAVFSSPVRFAS
eukprot:scaffold10558_cov111-Isochrysis_galbana.AAC.1